MREADNSNVIAFIIVASIIFVINLIGIFYGAMVDGQVEEAREVLRIAHDKEYGDELSKIIADLEMNGKVLFKVLIGFLLKVIVGALLVVVLAIPEYLYKKLECNLLTYITPNKKYEVVINAIIIVMSVWNIVSPFLEAGDFISLYNEIRNTLVGLKSEALIKSMTFY